MTDDEIKHLKSFVGKNLSVNVYWIEDDGLLRQVTRIGKAPIPKDPSEYPEPSEVAYIRKNVFGSPYLALSSCDRNDFVVMVKSEIVWPEIDNDMQ